MVAFFLFDVKQGLPSELCGVPDVRSYRRCVSMSGVGAREEQQLSIKAFIIDSDPVDHYSAIRSTTLHLLPLDGDTFTAWDSGGCST